jgi:hypothetical protein
MRPTPPLTRRALAFAALALSLPATAQLVPVTGPWTKDSGGGPAAPLSGANTDSPVVGNGTPSSADDVAIKAPIPRRTLAVGDSIQVIASVALSGIDGDPTQFWWQIREGLFDSRGQAGTTNWLGYFTNNSSGNRSGDLHEKVNPNSGLYISLTGATDTFSAATAPGNPLLADGTYDLSLKLTHVASGMTVDWSIDRTDGGGTFSMHPATFLDTTPQTYTFDYVGFLVGDFINADRAAFGDVRVTAAPEPAPTACLLASLLLPTLRRRR